MTYEFSVSDVLPADAEAIYNAWISSEDHTEMTGGEAHIDPTVGGAYDAWDGYIHGVTLVLEPHRRIVQSWRTTEFEDGEEDSAIEVTLEPVGGETRITVRHSNVPDEQRHYEEGGWQAQYFDPMQAFFS